MFGEVGERQASGVFTYLAAPNTNTATAIGKYRGPIAVSVCCVWVGKYEPDVGFQAYLHIFGKLRKGPKDMKICLEAVTKQQQPNYERRGVGKDGKG